jgi:ribosomal protein S18 acetylase RimI-like enzyme
MSAVPVQRIRAASVDDAGRIAEIHVAGWRWAYRGQMPQDFLDALSLERRTEERRRALETPRSPEHRHWLIEERGRVQGFAITGPCRDADMASAAELYAIYVDPTVAGRGLGRGLLTHAVDDLRRRGARVVLLWVLDANLRARRFYEAGGFEPDGADKTQTFGGAVLREVRYRKVLDRSSEGETRGQSPAGTVREGSTMPPP